MITITKQCNFENGCAEVVIAGIADSLVNNFECMSVIISHSKTNAIISYARPPPHLQKKSMQRARLQGSAQGCKAPRKAPRKGTRLRARLQGSAQGYKAPRKAPRKVTRNIKHVLTHKQNGLMGFSREGLIH